MATNQSAGERAFETSADINGFANNGSSRVQVRWANRLVCAGSLLESAFPASGKLNDSMKPLLHRLPGSTQCH